MNRGNKVRLILGVLSATKSLIIEVNSMIEILLLICHF